jgi:TPR repeat protein
VERDYVQALFWLDLAAAQGNAEARDIRGQIAARMTPALIAEAEDLVHQGKPQGSAP